MSWKLTALSLCILLLVNGQLSGQETKNRVLIDPLLRIKLDEINKEYVSKAGDTTDRPILYPVVIHGTQDAIGGLHDLLIRNYGTLGTANLSSEKIINVAQYPGIHQIEYSPVHELQLNISRNDILVDSVYAGFINNTSYTGKGVIIGIIDTGIDFHHPDFRDPIEPDKSRILRIWDISLSPLEGENHPGIFENGVEYVREDIERELRNETSDYVRSKDNHGHGTHIAGVAGGGGNLHNGLYKGVAPGAEFIVVKFPGAGITTKELIHGIEYIFYHADKLNRPAVINISVGGHGGSHDGTAGHEQVIDYYSRYQGRVVVAAAGNSGTLQNHTGDEISPGASETFMLNISNYSPRPGSNNNFIQLYLWYEGTESLSLIIETPSRIRDTVATVDSVLSVNTSDGHILISTNPTFINDKEARFFDIRLSDKEPNPPPNDGIWRFTIRSLDANSRVRYNTWIVTKSMDKAMLWPSTSRNHTVTMPGTAEKAVTVGAYNTKVQWIDKNNVTRSPDDERVLHNLTSFSGGGPTRDLRRKPDITAPGRFIGSSLSRDAGIPNNLQLQDEGYTIFSGTSISTAHITGVVALMLEANPFLQSSDILKILQETARHDEKATDLPNNEWGWGKANAFEAVRAASVLVSAREKTDQVPSRYELFQNYPNPFNPSTNIRFHLPERTIIQLRIFDVLGREIGLLINDELDAGVHTIQFHPDKISTGVYYCRLETPAAVLIRSMLFVR